MADALGRAVDALRRGELVAYPTDTLYGLAASARDDRAVARLAAAKRRPEGMPISVALSSVPEAEAVGRLTSAGRALLRRLLPGPYTLLLSARPSGPRVATALRGADGSLGVRVPDHPVARELARRAGPITATSANRHGDPPGRSIPEIRRAFGSEVSVYLGSGPAPSGRPSQLVDLRGSSPRRVARRSGAG